MKHDQAQAETAEVVVGRALAKGHAGQHTRGRTQSRAALSPALDPVRQAARDRAIRLTALWHHVYASDRLREAYDSLHHDAAPGVDGQTWAAYGEPLETTRRDVSDRLTRGTDQASPVTRVDIPQADDRQRPLGKPTLEDKIVQRAPVEVLNALAEEELLGFSYGARPERSPHQGLDAVTVGIEKRHSNGGRDADIWGFFGAIDPEWLVKCVEHRMGDQRVVRHIHTWRNAGVREDGPWRHQEEGTPQGGRPSPWLAHLYLHDGGDLWAAQWRRRHARGDVMIVRSGDDVIAGCQPTDAAEPCLRDLRERCRTFTLERHPDQTRLVECGRDAVERRPRRGQGTPETVDVFGLTHMCGQTTRGVLTGRRKTIATGLRRKLRAVTQTLRQRLHWPIQELGAWLKRVVGGHDRYDGVPRHMGMRRVLRERILRDWCRTIRRRSQRHRMTWQRMYHLLARQRVE